MNTRITSNTTPTEYTIEVVASNKTMKWENICGFTVEMRIHSGGVQRGEYLCLAMNRDEWKMEGSIVTTSSQKSGFVFDNRVFVRLEEGVEVEAAIRRAIDAAVYAGSHKLK